MNLHMTGIAAALVFPAVVYAMLHRENIRKKLLQASLVLISTLIALPLTPYGLDGLIKVSMVRNESKGLITEWSNVFFLPLASNMGILFLLAVALVVIFFIFKQKQFLYGLLTVALIYGTYDTIRLTPFLLTVMLAALAFLEVNTFRLHPRLVSLPVITSWLLLVATLTISALSVLHLSRVISDDESMFPVSSKELALIPENSRAAVTQDVGSAIILFRPDVLVTLDGRNDLIGAERFVEASNILYSMNSAEVSAWLNENDINAVFIADSSAVGADIIADNMKTLGWDVRTNETDASAYTRP
jgi:hypothetical protein